jgi:hypothetical protein
LSPGTRADRAFRYLWKFIRRHLHQRLDRSGAIERLERLEQTFLGIGQSVPDVTGQNMAVCARDRILERPFHVEKTRSKPLNRAIYTIFYR